MQTRFSILIAASLLAGCQCNADPKPPAEDATAPVPDHPIGTTRRLSNVEIERSLGMLVDVKPTALDRLPPDGLGHSYDRIVESQTMSRSHLDAFFDIATQVADTLVAEARLDDIAPACADHILPPLRASASVQLLGAGLSLGPEWAVQPGSDPDFGRTVYAPDVTASLTHDFPSAGLYNVAIDIDVVDGPFDDLEARFGGVLMDTFTDIGGPQSHSYDVVVASSESAVLHWDFLTDPDYHNLNIEYQYVRVEGPIDSGAGEFAATRRTCAEALVDELAPRAFRRPVSADERDALLGLYDEGAGEGAAGFRMLFQGIFANTSFLYVIEEGEPIADGVFELNDYEIATRLSLALCEQPPDDTLRAAAAAGEVHTVEQIEAQALRLMDEPCARETVRRFLSYWLHLNQLESLNKSPEAFPSFTDAVRTGLVVERDAWLDHMFWDEQADLTAFFTSDKSWPDPASEFLANSPRTGILQQPALLAVTAPFDSTSPVRRGVFVLEQVLCKEMQPPPVELDVAPPLPDPGLSTRERWAQHSSDPVCRSCHAAIDPIGFLFEEYDGIGQFRTEDDGHPVDASGGIPILDIEGLWGVEDLGNHLATSDVLAQCFATQWLRFSLGRMEQPADVASIDNVASVLTGDTLHEGIVEMLRSPSFRQRFEEVQ